MSNKNSQNLEHDFTKLNAKDKMEDCLKILEFVTDAIYVWNPDALDFNENHRAGYTYVMDKVREDIAKSMEIINKKE